MKKTMGAAGAAAVCMQLLTMPTAQARPVGGGGQAPGCVPRPFTRAPSVSNGVFAAAPSDATLRAEMLAIHNAERSALGLPNLTWDDALAAAAQRWATHLITRPADGNGPRYSLIHDQAAENLSGGATAASFSALQLAQGWVNEKPAFQDGVFPNVSITCNWATVGHYTQMVWRDTTKVGCALGTQDRARVLVCRYSPAGNVDGQRVLVVNGGAGATPAVATTATAAPAPVSAADLRTGTLAANNKVRADAGLAAFTWDADLAAAADAEAGRRMAEAQPNARALGAGETMGYAWNTTSDASAYPAADAVIEGSIASGWQRNLVARNTFARVGCGTRTWRTGADNRRIVVCRYA